MAVVSRPPVQAPAQYRIPGPARRLWCGGSRPCAHRRRPARMVRPLDCGHPSGVAANQSEGTEPGTSPPAAEPRDLTGPGCPNEREMAAPVGVASLNHCGVEANLSLGWLPTAEVMSARPPRSTAGIPSPDVNSTRGSRMRCRAVSRSQAEPPPHTSLSVGNAHPRAGSRRPSGVPGNHQCLKQAPILQPAGSEPCLHPTCRAGLRDVPCALDCTVRMMQHHPSADPSLPLEGGSCSWQKVCQRRCATRSMPFQLVGHREWQTQSPRRVQQHGQGLLPSP